ncbi:CSS-motif domain-containing protein, partial [Pantoea sp. SIMBA_072]
NWQIDRDLRASSHATAAQVVEHVERILDSLSSTAHALLPLAGSPCTQVKLALRGQVTRNAFVRSTNLFQHNTLYCSSLF